MPDQQLELTAIGSKIELLILDVDGVLTDGRIYYGADGEELKPFHVHDGLGMKLLQGEGVQIAVITARKSRALDRRMSDLGIVNYFSNQHDKLATYETLLKSLALTDDQVAYVGDDIIDMPVMKRVGLSCSPADGHQFVKDRARLVTRKRGGRGAVREIADFILDSRFGLETVYERFSNSKSVPNKGETTQ